VVRGAVALVVATLILAVLLPLAGAPARASASAPTAPAVAAVVRVDELGYPTTGPKVAYLMSPTALGGTTFEVVDSSGTVRYSAAVGADSGKWNGTYRHVYPLTFTPVDVSGTDTIVVEGPTAVSSPTFPVGPASTLWSRALANSLSFYQDERDGPDYIPSVLRTAPAHLNDEDAMTYATPAMNAQGDFQGNLTPLGLTIDASGGWWDAGDYLKFVETTSYAVALLEVGARTFPASMGAGSSGSDFDAEARFGIEWLEKMWDDPTRTLYYQVGIGEGNATTTGDHDLWRLPQADDTYGGSDPADRYIRNRPVFEAAPAGSPVSPNLAGRLAADFGLCAQLFASSDPTFAATCLTDGEDVYALADTHPTGKLLTTAPYGFYPETQWRDDMELGATELAAAVGPGAVQQRYLGQAADWAAAYDASSDHDTLNLYDVSGLAHYELARLLTTTGTTGLAVTPTTLEGQMAGQLDQAITVGTKEPFGFGVPWRSSDTVSHGFGLSVMASEYDALTGTTTFATEAQGWADNVLGADPWGVSFVVGDGTTFPDCMQDQVANLLGSTDGSAPVLAGAAVEGPTAHATRGLVPGMVSCPPAGGDASAAFNGHGAVYKDDVQSYSTDEPAIDLTAASPLAFAWLASSGA
jgi:endoglucanase